MCALVVDRRSAEAPVRNLSKASVKLLATLGPHVKLPTEMSNFPTLGPWAAPQAQMSKYPEGPSKFTPGWGPTIPPTPDVQFCVNHLKKFVYLFSRTRWSLMEPQAT